MQTARTYLLHLLLIMSLATTAHAQGTAKRDAQEKEMNTLVTGMRAVSGCPALIEDWEYSILDTAVKDIVFRLTGSRHVPPSLLRSFYAKGDKLGNCENPLVKTEAAKLRAYAHSRWLGISRAFLDEPTCPKPSPQALKFLKALEGDVVKAYQRKIAPGPTFDEIAAYSNQLKSILAKSCKVATGYFSAQVTTLAPLLQLKKTPAGEEVRLREFDFNAGFTLRVGDAGKPGWRRHSGVVARRSDDKLRRAVIARHSMCGGQPLENDIGITQPVACTATLESDGTLIVKIAPANPVVELKSATLVIVDLQTGKEVFTKTVRGQTDKRTAGISDALTYIRQAPPYHQVHVRLGLRGETVERRDIAFHHSKKFPGMPTVAAIDFVKAARYAFAPETQDRSKQGLVTPHVHLVEKEARTPLSDMDDMGAEHLDP